MSSERDIEYIAEWHPYLIHPEFDGLLPERQLRKGRYRLDMMFHLRAGKCIVELKKTTLNEDDLNQLVGYCRTWENDCKLAGHHYLVGKKPDNLDYLINQAKKSPFRIRFRFLGLDIPLTLAWSVKAEKYIHYDDSQQVENVIRIRV